MPIHMAGFLLLVSANLRMKLKSSLQYDPRCGCRQKHSTNLALLSMTQQIKDIIDKGNLVIGVFKEFQKAFDTVDQ